MAGVDANTVAVEAAVDDLARIKHWKVASFRSKVGRYQRMKVGVSFCCVVVVGLSFLERRM
jgi:hypothetical protein